MSTRISKYEMAFELIGVPYGDKAKSVICSLEKQGHTEKSICFAIWKEEEKLSRYRHDEKFWGVFVNSIRKWSWPKDDIRWVNYEKRKKAEVDAGVLQNEARLKGLQEAAYRRRFPGYVYFIQGSSGGPIKIGYAKDVKNRLIGLQTGHPDTLIVLGCMVGSQEDEQDLHEKFASYRVRGEWFQPEEPLMKMIREL